jgi:tetratricopeptide (TPR) repeat protein
MKFLSFFFLIVFVVSCGTKKHASNTTPKRGKDASILDQAKDDVNALSAKSYPYIEAYHQGLRYKSAKNYTSAKQSFNLCLTMRQNDDAVHYALSQISFALDEQQNGMLELKKAADLDPKNLWYAQELAYTYLNANDFKNSVIYFDRFLKKEERNPELLYAFAEALTLSGDYDRALPVYEKVISIVGNSPELSIRIFQILATQNKLEKAEKVLKTAYDENPENQQLLNELLNYYKQTRQGPKADALLQGIIKNNPKDGGANLFLYEQNKKNNLDAARINVMSILQAPELDSEIKGNTLIDWQNNEINPLNLIEPALYFATSNPTLMKAQIILGDVYLNTDQTYLALEQYKKALVIDQSNFQVWNQVLSLAYNSYDHLYLYTEGKKCVELFPSQSKAYLFAGSGAIGEHHFEEGKLILNSGKEFVVKDNGLLAEFEATLGEAYFGMNNTSDGIKAYEKSLSLVPNDPDVKNRMALSFANTKIQLDKALQINQEAINAAPKNEEFLATRAWILQQKGETDQVLSIIQKAIEMNPKNGFVQEKYGDILSKQGKPTEALVAWKKAKEFGIKSKLLNKKIETKSYHDTLK